MTIEELLEQCIQKNLIDLTISGLKKKNEELPVMRLTEYQAVLRMA